jgi:hypothetical protein
MSEPKEEKALEACVSSPHQYRRELHQALERIFHISLRPHSCRFYLSALAHDLSRSTALSSSSSGANGANSVDVGEAAQEPLLHEGLIDAILFERLSHFTSKSEALDYLIQSFERATCEVEQQAALSPQIVEHVQRTIATHFGLVLQDTHVVKEQPQSTVLPSFPGWVHLRDRILQEFRAGGTHHAQGIIASSHTNTTTATTTTTTISSTIGGSGGGSSSVCSASGVPTQLLTLLADQYEDVGLASVIHPLLSDAFTHIAKMTLVDSPEPWYHLLLKLARAHRNYCQLIRTHSSWLPKMTETMTSTTNPLTTGRALERQTLLGVLCAIGTYRHFAVAHHHFVDLLPALQKQTLASLNMLETQYRVLRSRVPLPFILVCSLTLFLYQLRFVIFFLFLFRERDSALFIAFVVALSTR